jgi:hypothetical protein
MDPEIEKTSSSSASMNEGNKTIWTEDEYMLATLGYKQGGFCGHLFVDALQVLTPMQSLNEALGCLKGGPLCLQP